MDGTAVVYIIIILLVLVVVGACLRDSHEEKTRGRKTESEKPKNSTEPLLVLRGDLAKQFQTDDRTLTAIQKYAKSNNLWVCPRCETLVNKACSNCFICDCPRD